MKKIQILYPDPQMDELKQAARQLDRPISEIVREATAEWLRRHAPLPEYTLHEDAPLFSAGQVRVSPENLREESYRREQL